MDSNFEMEIQENQQEDISYVQLPTNFLTFGEIENDDVRVYIKQDVYKALEKFSLSDTSKELGSIIIGDYSQELGKTCVIVSNYIEAKYTDASASTLTFTHKTWEYIHTQHERLYPDKKIIGWQHTHPNYGIFLSNYDLFIQENFFNLPFQIAYVIDPIQKNRGFFQWKNGKIEKLKGYYIYDDVGKTIKIEEKTVKVESEKRKNKKWIEILIAILVLSTTVLSCCVFTLWQKYEEQLENQKNILNEFVIQEEMIANQSELITKIQEQLVNSVLGGTSKIMVEDIIEILENNGIVLENQEDVLNELKAIVDSSNLTSNEIKFIKYTVTEGDTLDKICKKHNIDYHSNINIILKINDIKNENIIYVGQKILLPIEALVIE